MTATRTPARDQYISLAEGVLAEAWDALACLCHDCTASHTGWCDRCAESQARVDEITPILTRLYAVSTDGEARTVAAGLPSLALAVAEGPVAA